MKKMPMPMKAKSKPMEPKAKPAKGMAAKKGMIPAGYADGGYVSGKSNKAKPC